METFRHPDLVQPLPLIDELEPRDKTRMKPGLTTTERQSQERSQASDFQLHIHILFIPFRLIRPSFTEFIQQIVVESLLHTRKALCSDKPLIPLGPARVNFINHRPFSFTQHGLDQNLDDR